MGRRFCRSVLYGLACLTTSLSTNAHGSDFQTNDSVGTETPDDSGVAGAPEMIHPMQHDAAQGDSEPDQHRIRESFESYSSGRSPRGIIPPGTLGQTYLRVSHPVPLDKHPRTGM